MLRNADPPAERTTVAVGGKYQNPGRGPRAQEAGMNTGCFKCSYLGCSETFRYVWERDNHQRRAYVQGHGRVLTATPYDCVECKQSLRTKADLHRHGKQLQHQPYACECGSLFSRQDVLDRHLTGLAQACPSTHAIFADGTVALMVSSAWII